MNSNYYFREKYAVRRKYIGYHFTQTGRSASLLELILHIMSAINAFFMKVFLHIRNIEQL